MKPLRFTIRMPSSREVNSNDAGIAVASSPR